MLVYFGSQIDIGLRILGQVRFEEARMVGWTERFEKAVVQMFWLLRYGRKARVGKVVGDYGDSERSNFGSFHRILGVA